MTKKTLLEVPKADQVIKGKDGKEWHIDAVKAIFIKTDMTIDRMAQEMQLPKAQIERLARTGEHSWNKLKEEHQNRWMEVLTKRFDDSLMEKQSLVQRLEEVTLMELAYRIKEIEDHFLKWGDFFVRDVEGEIVRDGRGQALRLQLPNSPKDLLTLKGLEEAKITNARLIAERQEMKEEHSKNSAIDVDALLGSSNES